MFKLSTQFCTQLAKSALPNQLNQTKNRIISGARTMAQDAKKAKILSIGTHNGTFHCDEILACFMLQQLPQYQNAEIVRSRDDAVLKGCDIVVDVGSVFDESKQRFDHHQNTFQHTLGSLRAEYAEKFSKVRLSSAGLVYTYFGEEVIKHVVKQKANADVDGECLRSVFEKVYENFIEEIDGIDNGVAQFADEPTYRISTHLSARIGHFNSQWNSSGDFNEQVAFEKAKTAAGAELVDCILYYATVWWPARSIVDEAIKKRFDVHPSGKIIELEQFCPWKQHLYVLEKKHQCEGELLYCVFGQSGSDNRVICVPNTPTSFICRKFLPEPWRGVRDDQLAAISGIPAAKFCHATGFIGGASTRDGTLQMAITAVEYQ